MLAVPQFAPLSTPLVEHMLPSMPQKSDFENLLRNVQPARQLVFEHLRSELGTRPSLENLLQHPIKDVLQEKARQRNPQGNNVKKEYTVVRSTLSDWRERNLLLREWDLENIAGLRIAAFCDERVQGYFPASIELDEPRWWCFSIAPPVKDGNKWIPSPILPCPVPLPARLIPGTFLFSPWPVFAEGWRSAGAFGAAKFHNLTVEGLEAWQPDLLAQFSPTRKVSDDLFDILAESVLLSKIREILLPLALPSHSPFPHLFHTFDPERFTFDFPLLLQKMCY